MALRRSRPDEDNTAKSTGPLSAGQVRDFYHKGVKDTRAQAHEYWLNYAALKNEQWTWVNPETHRLEELPRDPDRVQVTINKLLPASRTVISKSVQRMLVFDVEPTAADDATERAAKIAEAQLRHVAREHDWEQLREAANWKSWRGGYAAIAVDWDASAGVDLGETTDGKRFGTGDTKETVLSAVEFVVEPGVKIAKRARWWIKAIAMPPDEAQATYKLKARPKADATAGMSPLQHRLLADLQPASDGQAELTLVLTYYERPNSLRPAGLIQTVIGDEIVDGPHDWYFPFKERLNFALQRETYDDNHWTGTSVLSAARPVQVAFNASWSSIIEHMKLAGNARLAVPQSAVDLVGTLTDLPAEVMIYPDGSTAPEWKSPPQMPAWWIEQPARLKDELDDILGVHEVTRGDAPPNIESGYGLSVLAENDSTPLGRLVKESAGVWGDVATMVLKLYAAKVTETRSARVQVPGQPPETTDWTGKDLMGQTTANVPVDAVMPRSRAAMQALAEKMLQMKVITNVAQFTHVADLPGAQDLITAVAPDIAKARRENHLLAQGVPCEPDELIDDHASHIPEHKDFAKSARYAMLPKEAQDLVRQHIQAHITLQGQAAGQQVAAGMVGGPALAAVTPGPLTPEMAAPMSPGGPALPGASDLGGPGSVDLPTPPPESDGPSRLVPPTE